MVDVRMPDGQVVRFPDGLTEQQIGWLIRMKYPDVLEAVEQLGPKGPTDCHAEQGGPEVGTDVPVEDAGPSDPVGPTLSVEAVHAEQPLPDRDLHGLGSADRDEGRSWRSSDGLARDAHAFLAGLSSHIDRAKLLTALIKANGGRPLR